MSWLLTSVTCEAFQGLQTTVAAARMTGLQARNETHPEQKERAKIKAGSV
jgi:hypothetical protein